MMQADAGRPRVLLADDDAGVLRAISRTLATDFEVVATVTDGREALDAVPLLDPDVVVLDISMPGLTGFQTAEELKRMGSRATIVFLTMHQDDGFVSKAIRVDISASSKEHEAWRKPIRTYFRRNSGGWQLVGLERIPDRRPIERASR